METNIYSKIEQLSTVKDTKTLREVLDSIGKLPENVEPAVFIELLAHKDVTVRTLSAKNLGKVLRIEDLSTVSSFLRSEDNTEVIRELISAIGRLRKEENIPILINYLEHFDPKVVMQAIRGLLVHKSVTSVKEELLKVKEHPNEMIREIIELEVVLANNGNKNKKDPNHTRIEEGLENSVFKGDINDVLKKIPENSVHLTFTSPPYYNAKDYSLYKSYEEYLSFLEDTAREIHRVTKEGRFFVLNTSPVLIPRFSRSSSSRRYLIPYDIHPRIVKLGFEFIEEIIWVKPEASATNRNGGFFQNRKPLAYKANHCTESVIVYRKKSSKLIDWNIEQYEERIIEDSKVNGDYFRSNVWKIAPSSSKHHPAIFPIELARNVIKFYSMKGDLVMDPFAGIGTVGIAALDLGRSFMLIDKEDKYVEIAMKEINKRYPNKDIKYYNNLYETSN